MSVEEVVQHIEHIEPYLAYHDEVQLLGYGETDTSGPYIKLRLQDPADLSIFRGKDKRTTTKLGQRYQVMLIEVGDDEEPVDQSAVKNAQAAEIKGGPLAVRAARLCRDPEFYNYVLRTAWYKHNAKLPNPSYYLTPEAMCRGFIIDYCNIRTRKTLDHDASAAAAFKVILGEYLRWSEAA